MSCSVIDMWVCEYLCVRVLDKETVGMRQGEKPAGEEQASPAARTYNIFQPSAAELVPLLTLCQPEWCTNSTEQHTAKHKIFFLLIFF